MMQHQGLPGPRQPASMVESHSSTSSPCELVSTSGTPLRPFFLYGPWMGSAFPAAVTWLRLRRFCLMEKKDTFLCWPGPELCPLPPCERAIAMGKSWKSFLLSVLIRPHRWMRSADGEMRQVQAPWLLHIWCRLAEPLGLVNNILLYLTSVHLPCPSPWQLSPILQRFTTSL